MLFQLITYLNFIRKSTNEHDVHSPFVFKFVTHCLYHKKRRHRNKSINILHKCIGFFDVQKVSILDHLEAAQSTMEAFPHLDFDQPKYDLVFANQFDQFHFNQLISEGKLHNDSVLLIDGIHQNPQKKEQWQALVALAEITVSIDMFYLGALFIRAEQEKEHFTIRI